MSASFTSTALTPFTKHELALLSDDEIRERRYSRMLKTGKKAYLRMHTNRGDLNFQLDCDMVFSILLLVISDSPPVPIQSFCNTVPFKDCRDFNRRNHQQCKSCNALGQNFDIFEYPQLVNSYASSHQHIKCIRTTTLT